MCTNTETNRKIQVGNGATDSASVWTSSDCKEITLGSAGECISEVTFYREDTSYSDTNGVDYDQGIAAMSFKTTFGATRAIGYHPSKDGIHTTYTPAQFSRVYSEKKFILPEANSFNQVSCLTGIDVTMLTTIDEPQNSYFWNVGVKYNQAIPKYISSECGRGGAAAVGGTAGGICCLLCSGAGIYYFFIKGKRDKYESESDPEPSEEEAPEQ